MLDRRAIPYLHWQPMLGRNATPPDAVIGEIVHGLADVEQAINTIVLTEKGSVPTQPEKCTRLMPYIDRRPDYAIPNITREIFDAITAWEPRVIVERVAITREDFDHWRFPVFWRLRADVSRTIRRTVVSLPGERIQAIIQ
jgi:phage baseplate assembly protein W